MYFVANGNDFNASDAFKILRDSAQVKHKLLSLTVNENVTFKAKHGDTESLGKATTQHTGLTLCSAAIVAHLH